MRPFELSALTVTLVIAVVVITDPQHIDWYIFPVSLCGLLTVHELLSNWGRTKRFNAGILADALAVHLMFLAPVLHVWWQFFMPFVVPPDDWTPWLGYMAVINLIAYSAYAFGRRLVRGIKMIRPNGIQLDRNRFYVFGLIACVLAAVLQVYVYSQLGGVAGYIAAFTTEPEVFSGWGWIFAISEIGPVILGLIIVTNWRYSQTTASELAFVFVMLLLVVLIAFFGGLKGSRNHYVWEVAWIAGLFAVWIKPFSKMLMASSAIVLIFFMMGYSYFKEYGANVGDLIEDPSRAADSWRYGGRVFEGVILGDFSRADVQAYELYKLVKQGEDYSLALGQTYLAAFAQVIPISIIGTRPAAKAYYGTWLLFGKTSADSHFSASNIYGLGGEAMMNFGILGVPMIYLAFGMVVGRIEKYFWMLDVGDARWILFPFIVIGIGWTLVSDLDNLLVFAFKYGTVPILLWWSSTYWQVRPIRSSMVA